MSSESSEETREAAGRSRHRSPNHPSLDLKTALERARVLLDKDGIHRIPVGLAHERWGYKRSSAIADQCIAAVRAYGLLNVEGEGEKRVVSVSDRARRILKNAPDRIKNLADAALSPQIHAELWEKYQATGVPQNDVLREYLLWERPGGTFNENVVDGFIDRFKDSLSYAGITQSGKIEGERGPEDGPEATDTDEGEMVTSTELTDTPKTSQSRQPGIHGGPFISFPLSNGNVLEIRLKSRVSPKDFERIKMLVELSEASLVEDAE